MYPRGYYHWIRGSCTTLFQDSILASSWDRGADWRWPWLDAWGSSLHICLSRIYASQGWFCSMERRRNPRTPRQDCYQYHDPIIGCRNLHWPLDGSCRHERCWWPCCSLSPYGSLRCMSRAIVGCRDWKSCHHWISCAEGKEGRSPNCQNLDLVVSILKYVSHMVEIMSSLN